MFHERKEYRKKLTSVGQLYVSGEVLDFTSYDVSVNGILVEIVPGSLLVKLTDFEQLIEQNNKAEIFVKDLKIAGEVDVVWARLIEGNIRLGLEFTDVSNNATKLWRKRKYFRSKKSFSGVLLTEHDKRLDFQGKNVSMDGLAIELTDTEQLLKQGMVVKLMIDDLGSKGVGKIVWIEQKEQNTYHLGLRYLAID